LFIVINSLWEDYDDAITNQLSIRFGQKGLPYREITSRLPEPLVYDEIDGGRLDTSVGFRSALARWECKSVVKGAISFLDSGVVVCRDYVPFAINFVAAAQCREHYEKVARMLLDLEFVKFKMPIPDTVFYLNCPSKFVINNIATCTFADYISEAQLLFEANEIGSESWQTSLNKVNALFKNRFIGQEFGQGSFLNFKSIECERNGHLKSATVVADELADCVFKCLIKGKANAKI
jgi:hypothetical protein